MGRILPWSELSQNYRERLERHGYTKEMHEAGVPKNAARGHANTPERPTDAIKDPERYSGYLDRRKEAGKDMPVIEDDPNAGEAFPAFVERDDPLDLDIAVHRGWSPRDRGMIARHWNGIGQYNMAKKESNAFAKHVGRFKNKTVGGYRGIPKYKLETRRDVIDFYLQLQTEEPWETLYEYAASLGK
jgi:hypothetical protein